MSDSFLRPSEPHVVEALMDPLWTAFIIAPDGRPEAFLRLEHPRHGRIDCRVSGATVAQLIGILQQLQVKLTEEEE